MNKHISFSLFGLIIFVIEIIAFFMRAYGVFDLPKYFFLVMSIISSVLAYKGLFKENGINIKLATFTLFFQASFLIIYFIFIVAGLIGLRFI